MGRNCHRLGGHGGDGGGVIAFSKSKRKANGCMAAFYHLFDFQHFYFPSSHHNLTIDSPSRSKGLKLIEESPPSTTFKDKQSLNIPVSMRVRTEIGRTSSRLKALATDTSTSSSEMCNSPGNKTPNLVARLMGLDLLPDNTDLNHSLSNLHTMTRYGSSRLTSHKLSKKATRLGGTRSLPGSPRVSSARKSDFDIHRLSLQLNKENKHEEFGCSRLKMMKQQDQEENRSPRDYARQIVKQIKERVVTRRVIGLDITNSVKNREGGPLQKCNELRRDTTVSCSPRTRFSDKENKPITIDKTNSSSSFRPEQITHKPKPKPKTVILVSVSKASGEKQSQKIVKQKELRPINQCKKAESETRFTQRLIKPCPTSDIQIKQREAFLSESTDAKASNPLHRKKFKTNPKSSDLDIISATKPPQKQINETVGLKSIEDASICFSTMHKTKENSPQAAKNYKLDDAATDSASSSTITSEGTRIDSEQDYITRIMKLAGIKIDSPVSSATTLDPSTFRELKHSGENQSVSLSLRCNRRLLFDLVNERLIETAKRRRSHHGSELIGELCSVVASYSSKRCPILGEIASMGFDNLLEAKKVEQEEGEEIIAEIEREIVEALVRETASELNLQHKNDVGEKTESLGGFHLWT